MADVAAFLREEPELYIVYDVNVASVAREVQTSLPVREAIGLQTSEKLKTLETVQALCRKLLEAGDALRAAQQKTENEGLSVVTTVFPVYDWLRNITEGTDTEVTMLMQNGSDLHNFQPSAKDIITINDADMFVYIGGESDEWTADVLREAKSSLESVSLMDSGRVSLVEDEVKEGMTVEEEEEPENDEHIWLSLQNAIKYTELLSEKLQEIDPDNAERYHQNAEAYIGKLMELAETDRNVIHLLADSGTGYDEMFRRYFPDQIYNLGNS